MLTTTRPTAPVSRFARLTRHHGTAVAYAALVLAVSSGGAYAAGAKVGPHDLAKDAVHSKAIKNGAVRAQDLAAGAVGTAALADGAVTGPKLATNSVGSGAVTDNSLTGTDIAEGSLGQVPDSGRLGGRLPSSFAASTVYKRESAVDAGTRLGDNTNSKAQGCDAGDILLAGGPANISATSDLLESFPTPNTTNSWSARINDNGTADNFSVVVLCLDQTP